MQGLIFLGRDADITHISLHLISCKLRNSELRMHGQEKSGSAHLETPQVGFELAGEHFEGSGLANAVGAHEPQHLTRPWYWQPARA